ncbi:TrsK-like protein [Paenibacillus pasadenensis]|uniref:TrsK-like protein n=1 Tax=Paenibacillus pasadenensis TaxID=217090 RepID=A0A2N5MZM8_9BACL|nr:type IV secretory system conjugative DNA transfer family protein [Paenibacillus pasadenensis]PLT43529.1 TrsK-like protein [Paenibacillus pasadenensis]
MNKYVKHGLRAGGYIFLHLWIIGTLVGVILAFAQMPFSFEPEGELAQYLTHTRSAIYHFDSVLISVWPFGPFEREQAKWTWTLAFLPAFLFLRPFIKEWTQGKFKEASNYGSHGSARWARRREVFRKGEISGSPVNELNGSGVILGIEQKAFGNGGYITLPPDSELNQNVLIYGNSGIGKGQTYVMPQIFHAMDPVDLRTKKRIQTAKNRNLPVESSLVVIDPKGEHYTYTAHSLEQAGYDVYCFNLVTMKASHRWNAMDYVDKDLDAEKLSNLLVPTDGHQGDPFWPKAEKALMSAIILFVKHELPAEQCNLANVLHIGLTYGRDEETLNTLFDALPYNHPAVARYNIFRVAPAETRAGILIGFGTQLSLFGYNDIQQLTSQSDFRFDHLGKKKSALFLIIPTADTTFASLTSLFFDQLFQQLWRVADDNGGTCPVGVKIIGDEFVNIGKIPMLSERTGVMRGLGISLQILVQAKSQLYKLYKDDTDAILQNFDTVVFLGTNDKKTAEEMSTDIGDGTIKIVSTSQQQHSPLITGNGGSESQQYHGRRLITPDELRKKSRRTNIILQNGGNPFKTTKTRFTEHPNAKGYQKLDPKAMVPPPQRGFQLFSQSDYNRVCGLILQESEVDPVAATTNFKESMDAVSSSSPAERILDALYASETESSDDEPIQAGSIEWMIPPVLHESSEAFAELPEEEPILQNQDENLVPAEVPVVIQTVEVVPEAFPADLANESLSKDIKELSEPDDDMLALPAAEHNAEDNLATSGQMDEGLNESQPGASPSSTLSDLFDQLEGAGSQKAAAPASAAAALDMISKEG